MEHESLCDEVTKEKVRTPPQESEKAAVRLVRPKKYYMPPRFPLLTEDEYSRWVNHRKEVLGAKHKVDDAPPFLFPELYLKPRRLDHYCRELGFNMALNKDIIKSINVIQRTGGFVDCWQEMTDRKTTALKNCGRRKLLYEIIFKENQGLYKRLLDARSEMLLTKELDEEWKKTKTKLIQGATFPFILFETEQIDRGIKDPSFDLPDGYYRPRVSIEIFVKGGSKVGKLFIQLFSDIVPKTCALFLRLIAGDSSGYAYSGTRIFRIVPNLYCRGGDVVLNNGFGQYVYQEGMKAENYYLKHTVPGVLSMTISREEDLTGQFNIIFKPLPQFDYNNVVFGRIVSGPGDMLERLSALGLPLGTTPNDVIIRSCGVYSKRGRFREGKPNTIKFPPDSKKQKK